MTTFERNGISVNIDFNPFYKEVDELPHVLLETKVRYRTLKTAIDAAREYLDKVAGPKVNAKIEKSRYSKA